MPPGLNRVSELRSALDHELEQQPINEDAAKHLAMELASAQYEEIGSQEYETERLRRLFQRQLRVAAYCRVSTDSEEQLTSYEAQRTYYTDKIMSNPEWTMAGLFADEGITGTSAQKRPEFLRMIRQCRQKKIDLVLTKSISRFARNTVDSLKYIRVLKELGIAVIFEEQNINTLESDNEMLLTIHSAFSQAESETMSSCVKWGKREAMREGRAIIQYNRLYGYRRGENNTPEIIPEQAEVVQRIYRQYLAGVLPGRTRRQAGPPMPANTPFRSGLCAASAGPRTAGVSGRSGANDQPGGCSEAAG